MIASIDQSGCIGCGLCADTCPSVFQMAADGMAEVRATPIPIEAEGAATEAMANCPVSVITIE